MDTLMDTMMDRGYGRWAEVMANLLPLKNDNASPSSIFVAFLSIFLIKPKRLTLATALSRSLLPILSGRYARSRAER